MHELNEKKLMHTFGIFDTLTMRASRHSGVHEAGEDLHFGMKKRDIEVSVRNFYDCLAIMTMSAK